MPTRVVVAVVCALLAPACGVGSTSPVCLGGASLKGGECRAHQAPIHFVPFRAGTATTVTQGFHGEWSHKNEYAYAADLACSDGTPVTASRPGVVWEVRDDSNVNCDDVSCLNLANYVVLDHGDGTYSQYFHLRFKGVIVEEGDHVCSGEVIGLCSNTGFATDPHVHFAVTDLSARRTIPFQFFESKVQHGFGFPPPYTDLVSANRLRTRCAERGYSVLGADAFAHQGIILDEPLPTVVTDRNTVSVRGEYFGTLSHVAIHRMATRRGAVWLQECVAVDADGEFEFSIDWPLEQFAPGAYWLMLTGADSKCDSPSWAWSYKVRVR